MSAINVPLPLRRGLALRTRDAELRRLSALARRTSTIVAGPWTGDLGFELLYWIPFLRWLTTEGGVDPDRVVAVSRGGVASWYTDVSGRYVEFDRNASDFAANAAGATRIDHLHPSTIDRLFGARWQLGAERAIVSAQTVQSALPLEAVEPPALPATYAVVKAYFNRCLPDTPDNRALLQRTIAQLAEQTSVVLLPVGVGDYAPFVPEPGTPVHELALEAPTNLAVQSRVVRGASLLVSVYGGFSYLGPYVGTPTVALYSRATPGGSAHVELIDRVGKHLGAGGSRLFRACHVGALRRSLSATARQAGAA